MRVAREWLYRQVESAEPSVDGEWFVLDLLDLAGRGFRYLEIHFDDDAQTPNAVTLTKEDGS